MTDSSKSKNKRWFPAAGLFILATLILSIDNAHSSIVTTGCLGPLKTCSLQELLDGGTIAVSGNQPLAGMLFETGGEIKDYDGNSVDYTIGFDVSALSAGSARIVGEFLKMREFSNIDFWRLSASATELGYELACGFDPESAELCQLSDVEFFDPSVALGRITLNAFLAGDEPLASDSLDEFLYALGFTDFGDGVLFSNFSFGFEVFGSEFPAGLEPDPTKILVTGTQSIPLVSTLSLFILGVAVAIIGRKNRVLKD